MVTQEEVEGLFTEFGVRVCHFCVIPDLVKSMEKIPDYGLLDVIAELKYLEKIPYSQRSKGSEKALKYINTFTSETFLSHLIVAINQIVYKLSKPEEQIITI